MRVGEQILFVAMAVLLWAADDEFPITAIRTVSRPIQGSTLPGDHT